jgi:4'-phosphopantetheinyl transferase EntD
MELVSINALRADADGMSINDDDFEIRAFVGDDIDSIAVEVEAFDSISIRSQSLDALRARHRFARCGLRRARLRRRREYTEIRIVAADALSDDADVLSCGFMGAPVCNYCSAQTSVTV